MLKVSELEGTKQQALLLFIQLRESKFGKTKKAKIEEIAKRIHKPYKTIDTWIRKYLKNFEEYLSEIVDKKTLKVLDFKGLTEKESKYVSARICGYSKKDALLYAGYSNKTKAADIEKRPKIQALMVELRNNLKEDVKLSASVVINRLSDIADKSMQGIEYTEIEEHDEVNPDGIKKYTKKNKKIVVSPAAAVSALGTISKMLGYDTALELDVTSKTKELNDKLTELKAKSLEKELENKEEVKVLK
ncbi:MULTISPECIES: terminase small subunit [unclassified Fusobacterium]|uniref:terminase small subunit n=1 Tax=unclassified Fusobacterium TaxID=2648384 RepID=UPI001B8D012E|nr:MULTISPECIES: terminase small subunit [unclassified Fusobacterium]